MPDLLMPLSASRCAERRAVAPRCEFPDRQFRQATRREINTRVDRPDATDPAAALALCRVMLSQGQMRPASGRALRPLEKTDGLFGRGVDSCMCHRSNPDISLDDHVDPIGSQPENQPPSLAEEDRQRPPIETTPVDRMLRPKRIYRYVGFNRSRSKSSRRAAFAFKFVRDYACDDVPCEC